MKSFLYTDITGYFLKLKRCIFENEPVSMFLSRKPIKLDYLAVKSSCEVGVKVNDTFRLYESYPVSYTHLDVYKRQS